MAVFSSSTPPDWSGIALVVGAVLAGLATLLTSIVSSYNAVQAAKEAKRAGDKASSAAANTQETNSRIQELGKKSDGDSTAMAARIEQMQELIVSLAARLPAEAVAEAKEEAAHSPLLSEPESHD